MTVFSFLCFLILLGLVGFLEVFVPFFFFRFSCFSILLLLCGSVFFGGAAHSGLTPIQTVLVAKRGTPSSV